MECRSRWMEGLHGVSCKSVMVILPAHARFDETPARGRRELSAKWRKMLMQFRALTKLRCNRSAATTIVCLALLSVGALFVNADEPYARSRDYDLEHSRIVLRFDVSQKSVIGDVTHSLSILRNGTDKISFDSVGLQIESVTLNKAKAKFDTMN